ncbi:hypothetical protein M427DRAFT_107508 [Gonapodya prolifera JEL478]|uniref:Muskelin N-terminal domain-containing protein n=1 Tax=Gonapodya prolifera (strain JEL478) TaxID=1344416 RepID=A0A139AX03_GONPJ|nr:hypothetical protein M427DRAFT_107508 [Gonapodya prolifera JEL478]|eukprot:KXS21272.1 hypothetical protein M427DRAFT_107508 [Gonapodya prolifera JEL478]
MFANIKPAAAAPRATPHAIQPATPHSATSQLPYSVVAWSSYSANYHPRNIAVSCPTDQASRWSSAAHNQSQYLLLKLNRPAIVDSITFGKYHKPHVCNLKEFRVLGLPLSPHSPLSLNSLSSSTLSPSSASLLSLPSAPSLPPMPSSLAAPASGGLAAQGMGGGWMEILRGGLRNDSEDECFRVRREAGSVPFPLTHILIHPLAAHSPSFNFSVWHVAAQGWDEPGIVERAGRAWGEHLHRTTLLHLLKHLRTTSPVHLPPLQLLQSLPSSPQLEHPLLTTLHTTLVMHGGFAPAQHLLRRALEAGIIARACAAAPPVARWTRVVPTPQGPWPGPRGGHQMAVDGASGDVYVHGGYDGERELGDLWRWRAGEGWRCLDGGGSRGSPRPSPRACHKLVLDPASRSLFVLGRYVEALCEGNAQRDRDRGEVPETGDESDFWRWDMDKGGWERLSADTEAEGGPSLVYDHQMVLDPPSRSLYVFGGRSQSSRPASPNGSHGREAYSGLYAYHIPSRRWTLVAKDPPGADETPAALGLRSRIGHSMVLDSAGRRLLVLAGQRERQYLGDLVAFTLPAAGGVAGFVAPGQPDPRVEVLSRDTAMEGGPEPGFTQRAAVDEGRGEVVVVGGIARERGGDGPGVVRNDVWVYGMTDGRWRKVYSGDGAGWGTGGGGRDDGEEEHPQPRFAGQVGYDEGRDVYYMFGGNPGEGGGRTVRERLDDLWEMMLVRPDPSTVLRRALFAIRAQQFREMCWGVGTPASPGVPATPVEPLMALSYLRREVAECVDHTDKREEREFREMAGWLFGAGSCGAFGAGGMAGDGSALNPAPTPDDVFRSRTQLFQRLAEVFPEDMREPRTNLTEMVPVEIQR